MTCDSGVLLDARVAGVTRVVGDDAVRADGEAAGAARGGAWACR